MKPIHTERLCYPTGLAEVVPVGNHTWSIRARTDANGATGSVEVEFGEPFIVLAFFPYVKTVIFNDLSLGRAPRVDDFLVTLSFEKNQYLTNERTDLSASGRGPAHRANLASLDGEKRLFTIRMDVPKPQLQFEFAWDYDLPPVPPPPLPPVLFDIRLDMIGMSAEEWDARTQGSPVTEKLAREVVEMVRKK